MRTLAILTMFALAACSADTPPPSGGYDPYADPEGDSWEDPGYDSGRDNPADDAQDDGSQDDPTDDGVLVAPEPDGPAHHDEVEPNDDVEHPTFIGTPDCQADAKLEGQDDNDWFSVSIEEAGPYVFATFTGEADDNEATDTRMEVYGRDDLTEAIASDDDAGEGPASRLTVDLATGTYYIRVIGYTTATEGEYTIRVAHPDSEVGGDGTGGDGTSDDEPLTVPPAQEVETESNGTLESADSLGSAPWTITATLDARDVDNFVFLVDAATTVTATTGTVDRDDDPGYTFVEILDADGRSLGSDDDGADEPMFSRLTVDLPEAGLYYVRVTGYSESTHGSYSLSID